MQVSYKNRKLEKVCTNFASLLKKYGNKELAEDIYLRLHQLHDFATLKDLKYLVDAKLHPLKGKRKYQLSIDAQAGGKRGKRRIIFQQENGDNVSDDRYNDKKFETIIDIKLIYIGKQQ